MFLLAMYPALVRIPFAILSMHSPPIDIGCIIRQQLVPHFFQSTQIRSCQDSSTVSNGNVVARIHNPFLTILKLACLSCGTFVRCRNLPISWGSTNLLHFPVANSQRINHIGMYHAIWWPYINALVQDRSTVNVKCFRTSLFLLVL